MNFSQTKAIDLEKGLFPTLVTSHCPMVFKHGIEDWQSHNWTLEYLCNILGDKLLDCKISVIQHEEFQWEPDCLHLKIKMRQYVDWLNGETDCDNPLKLFDKTKYSCYIDYKYMKEMFKEQPHLLQSVSWNTFGLTDHGGEESTIWIGSCGTYTPCHQDTYGFNLVAQIQGRKRWYLFSPDQTDCMYPTRIPYEESSIYSEVNVRCPDLKKYPMFQNTTPYVIELVPGDVLYVPRHWWHFVESLEPSISINTWIPVVEDSKSQLDESVTRLLYTCLSTTLLCGTERNTCLNTGEELQRNEVNLRYIQSTIKTLLSQSPGLDLRDNDVGTSETSTAGTKQGQIGENRQVTECCRNNLQKFCDTFKDYTVTVACLCGIDVTDTEDQHRSAGRKRKCSSSHKNKTVNEEVADNNSEMRIKQRKTSVFKLEQNGDTSELKNIHENNVNIQEDINNSSYRGICKEIRPESSVTVERVLEKDVRDGYSLTEGKTNKHEIEIYAARHFTFNEYVNFLEKVFNYELKYVGNYNTVDVSNTETVSVGNVLGNDSEKELDIINTELSIDRNDQHLMCSNTDRNIDEDNDMTISTADIINSILDPSVIEHIGHVLLNKIRK